jgi:hypothetical protein
MHLLRFRPANCMALSFCCVSEESVAVCSKLLQDAAATARCTSVTAQRACEYRHNSVKMHVAALSDHLSQQCGCHLHTAGCQEVCLFLLTHTADAVVTLHAGNLLVLLLLRMLYCSRWQDAAVTGIVCRLSKQHQTTFICQVCTSADSTLYRGARLIARCACVCLIVHVCNVVAALRQH